MSDLESLAAAAGAFVEIRSFAGSSTHITLREREVESAGFGSSSSFSVRALHKGAWGFAYTSDEHALAEAVSHAVKLAKASARRGLGARLAPVAPVQANAFSRPKKDPRDYSLDQKVALCRELLPDKPKGISTFDLGLVEAWGHGRYVNSEGTSIEHSPIRSYLSFYAYAKKGREIFQAIAGIGREAGMEILDDAPKTIADVVKNALFLRDAQLPPKGRMPVILDPRMAGVFAHEMVGHACEADYAANGTSILGNKLRRHIGSSQVNIVDDPTLPGLFGSYKYDIEGVPAQRTQLFKNGRLMNLMTNRETAAKLGLPATGNSRAQGVDSFPIVRMSNTFFEAGDYSDAEIFEGIDGVYAVGMKGGQTDPLTGQFQFAAELGFLIKDGERVAPLRDVTLVGSMLDVLKQVEACGKDIELGHPGFCGKAGQAVPVSDGGPHIRVKEMLVG